MRDLPIPFSKPMVRALFDGRKTQTRRVLTPLKREGGGYVMWPVYGHANGVLRRCGSGPLPDRAAPYAVGDRLWVREAWRADVPWDALPPRDITPGSLVLYEADAGKRGHLMTWGRYRHARFMPRWASRLTLLVTDVRVQRLQEISRDDAMEEGCRVSRSLSGPDPRDLFATLWDSLHGQGAWEENPWVCAISFDLRPDNIDRLEPAHA